MTRAKTIGLLAALLAGAAGCGTEEEIAAPAQTSQPAPAATATPAGDASGEPRRTFAAGVEERLDAGAIAVVDLANRVAIEPARLRANREQELKGLEWKGWGTREAVGSGTAETLVCEPNCALGQTSDVPATLTLSGVRACGSRRYYSRARLTALEPETDDAVEPAVYLRTPC